MKVCSFLRQGSLTLTLKFLHRKYINIRQITAKQNIKNTSFLSTPNKITQNTKSSNHQKPLTYEQLTEQQKFKHEKLKIGESVNKQQRMTKQMHKINYTIKNTDKMSQLLAIIKKHGHLLTVHQILNLFNKFTYLDKHAQKQIQEYDSLSENQLPINSQNIPKYSKLISYLEKLIMERVHPPQIYIKFIHIFSKLENQYIFNECYNKIFIKILHQQLVPEFNFKQQKQKSKENDAKKQETQEKNEQKKQKQANKISQPQLSQTISIQDNIILAQSLFRIFNHKTSKPDGQQSKMILSLLRNLINYIHLPSTPPRVSNTILYQLISQYYLAYPKLKLTPFVIKSISKQILGRVKNQGILEQTKNLQRNKMAPSLPQGKVINCLKKLLTLQKLQNQQYKHSSLNKQLIQSKPGSLPYNPFYAVQQRIHKHIVELLPKCHFRSSQFEQGLPQQNAWKHQQVVNLLTFHVKLLFTKMPIETLVKCELLQNRLLQFQAINAYIQHLYEHVTQIDIQLSHNEKLNYWRLLSYSYQLLYLLLSPQVQSHIPSPIVSKVINQQLINSLIKYYSHLPKELQIIVVWYIVEKIQIKQNIDESVMKSLIKTLIQSSKNHLRPGRTHYKAPIAMWHIQLLMGNQNYIKILSQRQTVKERQKTINYLYTLFHEIGNYQFCFVQHKQEAQIYAYLAQNIVSHISKWENSQKYIDTLLQIYKKKSNECFSQRNFKEHQIQLLKNYSNYFKQPNLKNEFISNQCISQLRNKLVKRINSMLGKTQLILQITTKYFGQKNEESKKYIQQIIETFNKQYQSLKYNGLYSPNHNLALGRINAFKINKQQIQQTANSSASQTQASLSTEQK